MRSSKRGDLNVIDKPKKSCLGFTYISAKLLNMLPQEIRNQDKIDLFKSEIK